MTVRRSLAMALTVSVTLAGLITVTATGASGAAPAAKVQPRSAVTNTSAYAVIGSVSLPGKKPYGVAVNGADDTVYVTNFDDSSLSIIDGQTLGSRRLGVGPQPLGIAVNQSDDTVYVGEVQDTNVRALNGRTDDSSTQYLAFRPEQIAVDQDDDTVYITTTEPTRSLYIYPGGMTSLAFVAASGAGAGVAVNDSDDTAYWSVANPSAASPGWLRLARNGLTADDTGTVGLQPYGVAVNQSDDTVYVANRGSGAVPSSISAISGRNVDDSASIPLGFAYSLTTNLASVAVDQRDDTIYTANASGRVLIINGRNTDDSGWVALPAGVAYALAVDDTGPYNKGFIYAGSDQTSTSTLYVIAPNVSPTLLNTSGSAGTPVTVSLSVPNLAPSFDLASTTVLSIKFGATNGTSLAKVAGTSTWSVVPPAGSGTVDVVVTFAGGKSALAGSFTYSGSPTPTPVYPPGAPTDVKAVAGSGEATVSWAAPTYIGSYPITDYQVTSSTGSHTCLTPSTSCTLT